MTVSDLGVFAQALQAADLLESAEACSVKFKLGNAVDQDEAGTSCHEELGAGMFLMAEYGWDVSESATSLAPLLEKLQGDDRTIYRAYFDLGLASDALSDPITRVNSPDNTVDFLPGSLSFSVGPVEIFDLGSDNIGVVGWMDVSISGNGYLFPWTFRDVVDRLEASPEWQRLRSVCRELWPVGEGVPPLEIIEARKQLGRLWPYDTYDRKFDWYWGIFETG